MRNPYTPEQLFAHVGDAWQAARGNRAMPSRAEISAAKLGGALRYVAVLDVVPGEPMDFRYRVLGQHLIDSYGFNPTGRCHTEYFPPAPVRPFFHALVRCVENHTPQDMIADFRNFNQTPCRAQARAWPLSDDGVNVTGILAGLLYLSAEAA